MSKRAINLDRLNESERRVLRLLAEGHTAKSIALAIGSTPAAVNERLREARRKTGIGSSRELARALKSHENRHDKFGVVRTGSLGPASLNADAEPWRPQTGAIAMLILFVAVSAAAAALLAGQARETSKGVNDPLIGTIPGSEEAPDIMYKRLRAEPRDAVWAPKAERVLRDRFSKIAYVGQEPSRLRVLCASSICEVAGTIDAPKPEGIEEDDPKSPLNRSMREVQDLPLFNELKQKGLLRGSAMFGSTGGKPNLPTFIVYFKRVEG